MADLLVYNPRRKRRKTTAKKRTHKRRRRRVVARHNPGHRRRRRAVHRRAHARRRTRRVRHNPRVMGINVTQIGSIAGGAIVTEFLASKLATMIPASWNLDANMARIGTKAAIGIGLPMVLRRFKVLPGGVANAIALGGGAITLIDIFKTYIGPRIGLGEYGAYELSSYEPGIGALVDDEGGAYGGSAY